MEEAPTMAYSYQREIRVYRRAQGALSRSRDGQDAGEMAPITRAAGRRHTANQFGERDPHAGRRTDRRSSLRRHRRDRAVCQVYREESDVFVVTSP